MFILSVLIPWLQSFPILAQSTPTINEFSIPTAKSFPLGMAVGPDGAVWFAEAQGNKIGRIDPSTHKITEITVPKSQVGPSGITLGPDNALWFVTLGNGGNYLCRIDPTTHHIDLNQIPTFGRAAGLTLGPDGALSFTEWIGNSIYRADITTTPVTFTETELPSGFGPADITSGPDGGVWFTVNGSGQIGRIDPTTKSISLYSTPTANSYPVAITQGPDGKLWFTETGNFTEVTAAFAGPSQIGRIDTSTTPPTITEFPLSGANVAPFAIINGPDNALWFTDAVANLIGRMDPTTHEVKTYSIHTSMSVPAGIMSGPDGALWFIEFVGNKIGEVVFPAAGAPTASFTANPTSGAPPLPVTFTDTSTGGPTSWSWNFGDKGTSALRNPTHTYTKIGVYTVTLTVSNSAGQNSTSQTINVAATPPGAPTGVSATPGNEELKVSFRPPASNGGSPITSYTATATPGPVAAKGAGSPITIRGLNNGQPYEVAVTATNKAGGTGPASSPAVAGTPATKPGLPTNVVAVAGDAEATVTFTAPGSDGGSAIIGYTVVSNPKGGTDTNIGSTSTSHLVTGLHNGTKYTFTVVAANAAGSTTSAASKPVIPATVPGIPTMVNAATASKPGTVTVTFKAPSDGGLPITEYIVTSSPGNIQATGKATRLTVSDLTSGSTYTFTVVAKNAVGPGQPSNQSNFVEAK